MPDFFTVLWLACGLFFILEGLMPFIAPEQMKKLWFELSQLSTSTLRQSGFICMMVGLVILWLVKP